MCYSPFAVRVTLSFHPKGQVNAFSSSGIRYEELSEIKGLVAVLGSVAGVYFIMSTAHLARCAIRSVVLPSNNSLILLHPLWPRTIRSKEPSAAVFSIRVDGSPSFSDVEIFRFGFRVVAIWAALDRVSSWDLRRSLMNVETCSWFDIGWSGFG
jgi:hypothetical protein